MSLIDSIRKKVRVPDSMPFAYVVDVAKGHCVVVLENPNRRYFVVECDTIGQLAPLIGMGCTIVDDPAYSSERVRHAG